MGITNSEITKRYANKFYPAVDFSSVRWLDVEGSALCAFQPETALTESPPSVEVLPGTGLPAVRFYAVGDYIRHIIPLPLDVDFRSPIYFRCHWSSGSETTTDDVNFTLMYQVLLTGGSWEPAGQSLDTAIPNDLVSGRFKVETTDGGVLAGGTINQNTAELLLLQVAMNATVAELGVTADEGIYLVGLEMAYLPRMASDSAAQSISNPWA